MSNSIDFLKQTKSLTTDTSSSSSENQIVKDKPSLFDSLLSASKATVNQDSSSVEEINTNSKIEVKNSDLKEDLGKIKVTQSSVENKEISEIELEKDPKNRDAIAIKEEKLNRTSSLLDKLILEAKKDLNTKVNLVSKEELKNLDTKTTATPSLDKSKEINTDSKVEVKNSDLKEEIGNIKNTLSSLENKETPEIDLKKDLNTKVNLVSKEELKNLDTKTTATSSLDKSKEINTDSKVEVKNSDLKEEIGNIKNTLSSVENKETPEIDLKKESKSISQEELNNLDKNINIVKKETISTDIEIEVSTAGENTKKVQTKVENKIISSENKESIKTELNVEEIILDSEKNKTENISRTEDEDISNNSKINISNTISVPLSDTLTSQSTSASSNNLHSKSLMDQLIQKNTQSIESISPEKIDVMQRESASKDFISNIYLSTQKNSINTQNLFNKNEAVNLLKDATNIKDVKTSAKMLDLGLEDVNIEQIDESKDLLNISKKFDIDLHAKRNILDNLMTNKNIVDLDVKSLITKSVEASSALIDDTLSVSDDAVVTVNSPLSYNIQSKIIGARQQMSTMMSDIAKQMYENYKPPVTVFKINLNPLELGSIAILMKNDKNNSLSISMNVSNASTLDALVDNQNILKTSLNKNFDENTKFNLNFSSSNDNNGQSNSQSNQNNQGSQNKFEQQIDTQSILELKEENKDREEKSIDYM